MQQSEIQEIVKATVHETLLVLGVDTSDPLAMQADFRALREFRVGLTNMGRATIRATITILVGAVLTALWIGVKHGVRG